jgi:MFS transporter, DHA1 family, multidrug resistance protein
MINKKTAILIGVSMAAFLGPFSQTAYAPSLPELGGFFHVNTVMVNLTISIFTTVLAISSFVFGPLADVHGRRVTVLTGLLVFCLGSLVCLLSTSYWVFFGGRMVQAFGISAGMVVAPAVVGDIYAPEERAKAMNAYQTVAFLGPVFGPVVGGLIAAFLRWQWVFAVVAVAGAFVWLYNRRQLVETKPKGPSSGRITWRTFRDVLRQPSAFSIILVGFSQFYGYYMFLVFLPMLLKTLFAVPAAALGFFFVPLTAGILVGIHISTRWQRQWARTRILSAASFAIGLSVLVMWLLLIANLLTVSLTILFLLTYGVLLGCSVPVQSTILVNVFSQERATAVGIYNFSRFMGAAAGPIVGGFVAQIVGLKAVFLPLAIILLVSAWVVQRHTHDPFESATVPA